MSQQPPETSRDLEQLAAYHDGELSGLARWRFERKLRRSRALREELEGLTLLRETIRAEHVAPAPPDLWEGIARRLPALDARREEAAGARSARPGLGWLAWPGAAAATAALALAFALGWFDTELPPTGGVVRWIDSGGRNIMVLEGAPDTTIIWPFDAPNRGIRREAV